MDEMKDRTEAELERELPENYEEDAEPEIVDDDVQLSELDEAYKQIAKLKEELSNLKDQFLRLRAEYENYRKRTIKEKAEIYQKASADCIEKLLPVIDSFERSIESECSDENYKNGMQMIFNQIKDFLTNMNVTEVDALGAEFDPNIHNAISQQDGTDYAANHVCAVYQKGYMMGDKLIRPAMVAVAQ